MQSRDIFCPNIPLAQEYRRNECRYISWKPPAHPSLLSLLVHVNFIHQHWKIESTQPLISSPLDFQTMSTIIAFWVISFDIVANIKLIVNSRTSFQPRGRLQLPFHYHPCSCRMQISRQQKANPPVDNYVGLVPRHGEPNANGKIAMDVPRVPVPNP